MASLTWPVSLPQKPTMSGFQEKPPKNTVRTKMDRGPDKVRRRTTADVRPYAMQFIMDETQLETFETFYTDTTKSGALRFDFPDPRTGTVAEFRFRGDVPTYEGLSNDLYRVTVQMEKLP